MFVPLHKGLGCKIPVLAQRLVALDQCSSCVLVHENSTFLFRTQNLRPGSFHKHFRREILRHSRVEKSHRDAKETRTWFQHALQYM